MSPCYPAPSEMQPLCYHEADANHVLFVPDNDWETSTCGLVRIKKVVKPKMQEFTGNRTVTDQAFEEAMEELRYGKEVNGIRRSQSTLMRGWNDKSDTGMRRWLSFPL